MSQAEPIVKVEINTNVKEPPLFKVIYLNDSQTTMEFVIESLIDFFNYSVEDAMRITNDIHELGSAVVALLPYEIAEQKGVEITIVARSKNYPLQIKLEPNE